MNLNDDKAKAELKSKYRTLCFRWHPDKVQEADQKAEAEKRFKQVAEAYNTISDPAKRMEYDRQLRHKRSSTAAHYNYGSVCTLLLQRGMFFFGVYLNSLWSAATEAFCILYFRCSR